MSDAPFNLPAPADYFPPESGRYEVRPGLSRLGRSFGNGRADNLIFQLDSDFSRYRHEKVRRRSENPSAVAWEQDCSDVVRHRVMQFIVDRLCDEHPAWFEQSRLGDRTTLRCVLTSETLVFDPPGSLRNFDALASQVQEDIAIVRADASRDWLAAIHLSFPNAWDPADKIGQDFASVHAPVAGMNAMNRDGRRLVQTMIDATDGLVRFAWGVVPDGALARPVHAPVWNFDPRQPSGFLRVERQTIAGFPDVSAALFTIRTYLTPLTSVKANTHRRTALAAALRSMPDNSRAYKSLSAAADEIANWLDAA